LPTSAKPDWKALLQQGYYLVLEPAHTFLDAREREVQAPAQAFLVHKDQDNILVDYKEALALAAQDGSLVKIPTYDRVRKKHLPHPVRELPERITEIWGLA
jgi:hypothetical protein